MARGDESEKSCVVQNAGSTAAETWPFDVKCACDAMGAALERVKCDARWFPGPFYGSSTSYFGGEGIVEA